MPWAHRVTSGTTPELTIHGNSLHDNTVPKIINPNIIYNSTGLMEFNGWNNLPNSNVVNTEFISKENIHFTLLGEVLLPNAFISSSFIIKPSTIYTFSGYFLSTQNIKVSLLYQTEDQINTINFTESKDLIVNVYMDFKERQICTFTTELYSIGAICIEHLDYDNVNLSKIKRLKLEEGNLLTDWIPNISDPYIPIPTFTGLKANQL